MSRLPPLMHALLLNRYTAFLLVLHLFLQYSPVTEWWHSAMWRMEVPLMLYLYFCLNQLTRPSRWQAVVTALPLFMLYACHDYYYMRFDRVPKWSEFSQLRELLGVIDLPLALALGFATLTPLFLLVAFLKISRRGLLFSLPALCIFSVPFWYPSEFIHVFKKISKEVIYFSPLVNVQTNGRMVISLYHEAKRRETVQSLAQYRDLEKLSLRVPPEMAQKSTGKNVHLIVLESFVDPTLWDKLPKRIQPAHPDYLKLVGNGQGLSISPIFGGYTAQPEFEVLCGVPAFQEFDEIEFNSFTTAKTYCLPTILREFGYRSTASNAHRPEYFNAMAAYQSLDFDAFYFAKEFTPGMETYLSKGSEENNQYFYDEELFAQNLAFIEKKLAEKKPFFNYLLTIYGHFPFELGGRAGPPLFSLPEMPNAVEKIVNQHYYRTRALAGYLQRLMAMDPTALIILVSDHLPPLPEGRGMYDTLGYFQGDKERLLINRFVVFREGKVEKYDRFAHFNIYRLILDFVTDHEYCRRKGCNFGPPVDREAYRNDYRTIIGLGAR
ncbi:MAG: sulfatase-like hydrolase/transferase [Magnetococcus sp. YQC-3]